MLKQRIITALVLVAILLGALFAEQPIYWRLFINLAILLGFWEWLRFCEITELPLQIAAYIGFAGLSLAVQSNFVPMSTMLPFTCALWLLLIVFTITDHVDFLHQRFIKLLVGMVVLSVACAVVINLKTLSNGPLWILCFMVSIWAADVGAYFVGRRFGKTKLAPKVSPGKTVEGMLGGLALALLIYIPIFAYNFAIGAGLLLLLTVVVTVLVSVLGDLFESKLKRHVGLKDSSQILPGHGGILDRIDSLLSGAPFFASGLLLLGYS